MLKPLFTVFGVGVRPFSACVCLGALAASALFLLLCGRRKISERGEKCLMLAVPLAVFCGHLLNCLVLPGELVPDFGWQIFLSPWMGGYMFYGAAAGACAAVLLLGKDRRRVLSDLMALSLLALVMCVRFAEPLDGQGNGVPVDDPSVPWCFFPIASPDPEWPDEWNLAVFFWEGLYALLVLALMLIRLKKRAPGQTALSALILYAAGQVIFESLRRDQVVRWLFVRVSQLISALILAAVVIIAVIRGLRGRRGVLLLSLTLLFIGGIIALEFAVEKPLILPDGTLVFFSLPLTYSLIALCAAGLGAASMAAGKSLFPEKGDRTLTNQMTKEP